MTEALVCEASKVGLRVNTSRTEIMKSRIEDDSEVKIEDNALREYEKLVYLACDIRKDGYIRNEVGFRIGKAGAAFRTMSNVWSEHRISARITLMFLNSIAMSVLVYGCESMKVLRELKDRVRRFRSGCLRKIMKIIWYDTVSEEELRARTGQKSVIERLRMYCWRLYGYVLRMPQERSPKEALAGWQQGSGST